MADWSHDVRTGNIYTQKLLAYLEDYGADEAWVKLTMKKVVLENECSEGEIKRAANTLYDAGRLEFKPARGNLASEWRIWPEPRVPPPPDPHPFQGSGCFHVRAGEKKNSFSRGTLTSEENLTEMADEITNRFFLTAETPPLKTKKQVSVMVRRVLKGGFSPDSVVDALLHAPVLTPNALEFGLKHLAQPVSAPPIHPELPQTREAPAQHPRVEYAFACVVCGSTSRLNAADGLRCGRCNEPWTHQDGTPIPRWSKPQVLLCPHCGMGEFESKRDHLECKECHCPV